MTYRDPLYDTNTPSGDSLEDQIEEATSGGDSTDKAKAKADEMKHQGQEAADKARDKGEEVAGQAREKGEELAAKGQDAMDQAKVKADEFGHTAHQKADEGLDKASEGLSTAADKLREQGEQQDGQVGNVAATAADKLDSASGYLRERDTNQIVTDLENLVRRRPMESLVAAAGIGLLLSRIIR
jgi:ElaB/YqjD/DUF883 family membrane-anchored ribosome-binding protein